MKIATGVFLGVFLGCLGFFVYDRIRTPSKVETVVCQHYNTGLISYSSKYDDFSDVTLYFRDPTTKELSRWHILDLFGIKPRFFTDVPPDGTPYVAWKTTNQSRAPYDIEIHIGEGLTPWNK